MDHLHARVATRGRLRSTAIILPSRGVMVRHDQDVLVGGIRDRFSRMRDRSIGATGVPLRAAPEVSIELSPAQNRQCFWRSSSDLLTDGARMDQQVRVQEAYFR